MNQRLGMIIVVSALLLAAPGASAAPSANDVPTRIAELNRRFAALDQALAKRVALLGRLDRYRRSIRDTRRLAAGPARDFKLRRLLAEARALAKRLSTVDQAIARHQGSLEQARQALLKTLAALKGAQRATVERSLARTRQGRRTRPRVLKVARPTIHPLDGPREIEEKADVLKDSEEKIRKRIQELEQVLSSLERRRRLRSISSRVDRYTGLFNEDSSSRRVTRIRPTKAPADGATQSGNPAPAGEADANTPGSYSGLADDSLAGGGTRSVPSGTYAVVLRDLLTPATLDALRKAGQSGDPAARVRALQKAREELRRAAAQLQRRSQAYRDRARQLRQRERK